MRSGALESPARCSLDGRRDTCRSPRTSSLPARRSQRPSVSLQSTHAHYLLRSRHWASGPQRRPSPHTPDQRPGGNPDQITGMGDAGVNRSIGSQWRTKVLTLRDQIDDASEAAGLDRSLWGDVRMNINLKLTDLVGARGV